MAKNKNFGPKIEGIELPQAIYLPPEILPLIPYMNLGELKVIIVAIAEEMRVGGSEPLSLSDFETRTGLSRPAVSVGLQDALERGILIRRSVEGYRGHAQFHYELNLRVRGFISKKSLPIDNASLSSSKLNIEGDRDLLLDSTPEDVKKVYIVLRNLGVYSRKALNLVENFPLDTIQRYIVAYKKAKALGKADSPGWLSSAIEQGWDITDIEKIVYHDGSDEDRKRYVGGEYSDFIQH